MDLQLKGKRVIVNGGTRGIGRMVAETLANEDSDVTACARNADSVAETLHNVSVNFDSGSFTRQG